MKYADVKWYLKHGQEVTKIFGNTQPQGEIIDSYWPSGANWAYQRMICKFDDKLYDVITRFGSVEGGRELFLYENTSKEGK